MKITECDLVVIGAGPGGYAAAFRAADKGLKTVLIEKFNTLGGVCLNVGCIPSKALLHLVALKEEMEEVKNHGLEYSGVKINLKKMRDFKDSVIAQMTGGLKQLSKARKVQVIYGMAEFVDSNNLEVKGGKDGKEIERVVFKNAIIATGSKPIIPPAMDLKSDLVMDSTDALELKNIPKSLLVVGGGVIGLEMGSVYAGLGSEVTVVEALDKIAGSADPDLTKILQKKLNNSFKAIKTNCQVEKMAIKNKQVEVTYSGSEKSQTEKFDKVLVSVGRKPNSDSLALDKVGVKVSERGFIEVDNQLRTSIANIFAIGDVVGGAMLAHKAAHEGLVAVDVILGKKVIFDKRGIPCVIYTNPEVAWVGLTETEAKAKGIQYKLGSFPWAASGRAVAMGKKDGVTKILFDPKTERVLGVGMVGANAGELIAEGGLALEMSAVMEDIALTVHAHPTVSETFMEAAENLHGMSVHIYSPKK